MGAQKWDRERRIEQWQQLDPPFSVLGDWNDFWGIRPAQFWGIRPGDTAVN
jgi:hypothetical protein